MPIAWEALEDAFENNAPEVHSYLHLENGEVIRIVDGIAAGHFPLHPAVPKFRPWVDCVCCEPDGLGLSHQYADWRRKNTHPELADYVDLSGGDRG